MVFTNTDLGLEKTSKKKIKINITPLIDIIFLLIIFFMMTSEFSSISSLKLKSSSVSEQYNDSSIDKTIIKLVLLGNARVNVFGKVYSISNFKKNIANLITSNKNIQFILEVSKNVLVQDLVSIIDIIESSGFTDISILEKNME